MRPNHPTDALTDVDLVRRSPPPCGQSPERVGRHGVDDREGVREDEDGEDRHPDEDRLLHPAQVDEREADDARPARTRA